jgi:hypothetical protein
VLRNARYWVPLIGAVACLYAASLTPPVAAYLLIITAFALLFDAGSAWLVKLTGAGGIKDFKQ